LKRKQNSHDAKEEICEEEWSGNRNNVGEGCITPYRRNSKLVNDSAFVKADTELVRENRYESNKLTTTSTTAQNKNLILNPTTEPKAPTCFTIDAILKKTKRKNDFATDKCNASATKTSNCDKFCVKSESFNNNTLQSNEVRYPSIERNLTFSDENQETTTQSPSRDSGVFLENDVPNIPPSPFSWMPPVTPVYLLHPLPLGSVHPGAGLRGFWNISPTTNSTGSHTALPGTGFDSIQSTTGSTGFCNVTRSLYRYKAPFFHQEASSMRYFMYEHNVSNLRPRVNH
jgi:hypothetical protein